MRHFLYVGMFAACACAQAPKPSPPKPAPPPTVMQEATPSQEERLAKLESDFLNRYHDKIAMELAKKTDDPHLVLELKILSMLIAEVGKELDQLEDRSELSPEEQDRYKVLIDLLAKQRKLREEKIDASYKRYRVEYRDLNRVVMPPESRQLLLARMGELRVACSAPRKIVVMGFGCSKGPLAVTERKSRERTADVAALLESEAFCAKGHIIASGLGVQATEEDVANLDPIEVERVLEKSRHAVLFLPK